MTYSVKHILVPLDFSPTSESALANACELASALGSRLTLLHATDVGRLKESLVGLDAIEKLAGVYDLPTGTQPARDPLEQVQQTAHQRMEAAMKRDECRDLSFSTVCVQGYPSQEIVKYAKENAVDMIVMGTHGRGPIGHLLLGSVAENVVRQAHCPVLTVRHWK